ncbi:carbon-nitrogen hydrolase family protein [Salinibacterium sp. NK8237]|uniref:carbon-nitrogen hydrolase family protein n=1 Tax=Salinibacterium sp. NK8237 TaxID=2792038 RepID=UPI0018CEA26D|nr:carbon-nitrogen hydrolase family protein [Salinibacterium sp. NK8237]MBH0131330.1 carbon-nitrogen hydrolase family protein [Salinibacterium sp. NK8237]
MTPASTVAVAQFVPGSDRDENIAQITELAERAVERGASFVVFPEYSSYFTATMGEDWVTAAEPLDGPFVQALTSLAQRLRIHLAAGMLQSSDEDNRFWNTLVAIAPTGAIVATYSKQHLYDAFGQRESDWVIPGSISEPTTFSWEGFTVGLQTCYDIRFPEVSRRLVDAGANLIVVPAEWVRGPLKEYHWRTLLTARAIENTVFLAAADHAPPIGVGHSMVVDPMGVELVTIGERTDVAVAHIELARLDEVRATNPALSLRRYGVHPLEER